MKIPPFRQAGSSGATRLLGQFAVLRPEDVHRLRQPTSSAMEIVRSVRMDEIDPVFLEVAYYVLQGNGGEHSCGLFYRALKKAATRPSQKSP
jgi:non-homologous end joining protein Ku